MRKLILVIIIFLSFSGFSISLFDFYFLNRSSIDNQIFVWLFSIGHIWAGLVFIVLFPMYVFDHLKYKKPYLKLIKFRTLTGYIQLLSGIILIFSGILLLLYGENSWNVAKQAHFILTFIFLISITSHYFVKGKQ